MCSASGYNTAMRICLAIALLSACGDDSATDAAMPDTGVDAPVDVGRDAPDASAPDTAVAFELSTSAFADGADVPMIHRCGPPLVADETGMNVSPAFAWTDGPRETMSYAMVVRDESAGGLVHWVIYDIPATLRALPERVPAAYMPLAVDGARQADIQETGYFGYFGPCSGGRGNRYVFTLHAMPTAMLPGAERTSTEDELAAMVEAASLASVSVTGIY